MKRSGEDDDDAETRKRLAKEIAASRVNEDKINAYAAALSFLEASKNSFLPGGVPLTSPRRLHTPELQSKVAEARNDLIEATVNLNQTELLVSRMQLSWGAPRCSEAMKARDLRSEEAVALLRQLNVASQQRIAAEDECRKLQELNLVRWGSLAGRFDRSSVCDADAQGAIARAIDGDDDITRTRAVFLGLCAGAGLDWYAHLLCSLHPPVDLENIVFGLSLSLSLSLS
jgi:hypothetical protein